MTHPVQENGAGRNEYSRSTRLGSNEGLDKSAVDRDRIANGVYTANSLKTVQRVTRRQYTADYRLVLEDGAFQTHGAPIQDHQSPLLPVSDPLRTAA